MPSKAQPGARTLAQKGLAGGLECLQVDGNDIFAVRDAMDQALKRARHGHGGTVLELVTYRLADHTTADDARRYRGEDEVKAAWLKEPFLRLRKFLGDQGRIDVPAVRRGVHEHRPGARLRYCLGR